MGVGGSNSTLIDHLLKFAVVCKEWRNVFEREAFRQLILSPSRLQDLRGLCLSSTMSFTRI